MSIIQIIGGSVILISCVLIIVLTLAQAKKTQDMSSALSGQSTDNMYGKNNKGTSRDDSLASLTKVMAIIFFVATIGMTVFNALGL